MTARFIELVKHCPCLYDTKDNSYKNLAIKYKMWEKIGTQINETGDVARKKWKSLRDNYVRYKKEAADTTGNYTRKFTKWPWAQHLQFLDSCLTERERPSNAREPSPELSSDIEPPSPEILLTETFEPDESPLQVPPPETSYLNSVNSSRPKRMKKSDSDLDKVINLIQNQEYDAIDHLFQSYAQTFKSFSKQKQIKAKVELAKLFASMESEELQEEVKVFSYTSHSLRNRSMK